MSDEYAVGIDVGGTKVKVVVFDPAGKAALTRRAAPLQGRSITSVALQLLEEIENARETGHFLLWGAEMGSE